MNGWLVDTDVVSELRKRDCDVRVSIWNELQPADSMFLSVVSLAEIRFGIDRVKQDARRQEVPRWLEKDLRPWFAGRILGISEDTLITWLEMVQVGRRSGHTFAQPDLFIAATARLHDLCVVTRNTSHFTRAGVPLFDPWENVLEMPGRKPVKINGAMTIDRVR